LWIYHITTCCTVVGWEWIVASTSPNVAPAGRFGKVAEAICFPLTMIGTGPLYP